MSPLERKRPEDEDAPGGEHRGPRVDLEERICPACRTEYPAWTATCPRDGAATVTRSALGPVDDPLLARFLEDGGGADDAGL